MNIFKGLLFLQEYLREDEPDDEDYGQFYGNHVANEKQFREPWDRRRRDPSLQPLKHGHACSVGGCG